jgi:hypothetical protein
MVQHSFPVTQNKPHEKKVSIADTISVTRCPYHGDREKMDSLSFSSGRKIKQQLRSLSNDSKKSKADSPSKNLGRNISANLMLNPDIFGS